MSGLLDVGEMSTNPFSPDFGQPPQALVGRETLLSDLNSGLTTGPSDAGFTSLLLGPRGSGKTVILAAMEDIAAASGWIVMSVDAGTTGLLERITQSIAKARYSHEGVGAADLDRSSGSRWAGVIRLGPFAWHQTVFEQLQPEWDLRQQFTALAQYAAGRGTALLLTVDEMHSGDRHELRRLAGDLQHITKKAQLPLAFLGAGLSQMKHTLLADNKMTFFQRCARNDMPPLSAADAMHGLRQTVRSANGSINDEALRFAAEASGTLPYRLQLVGHNAWNIAGAPQQQIDLFAAQEADRLASQQMTERISIPAWHDLGRTEQTLLAAVAELDDDAFPAEIAQRIDAKARDLAYAEERLTACGYLRETPHGTIALTDLIPATVVKRMSAIVARYSTKQQ
ncbi:MAG: ATP-binding protein [Acidimicrobiaceae bacterium]|nr:ATP-binding protein [Acidimicrobiaceae bacterium]